MLTFDRIEMFTRVPCFIIQYYDLIEQLDFHIPDVLFLDTFGCFRLIHYDYLSDLLFYNPTKQKLNDWFIEHNNIVRSILTSMGVYHNPNLRGKKQWTCNLRVNNVKSVTTHETYEDACKHFKKLKEMVTNGTFIQSFERQKISNIKLGTCIVSEGSDGERCPQANVCKLYDSCLSEAWKYDIKGWRISDTTE